MPCLHAVIRRLGRVARRFARARRANVAITFALTLIPMLALTGAAIDFSRANALKTALQQALDATVLMVSKNAATLTSAELQSSAQSYFLAQFQRPEAQNVQFIATYTSSGGSSVAVTGSADMPTEFMAILGYHTIAVNGSASFEGPNGLKLPLGTAAPANSDGKPAIYGIRPEHFTIADDGAEAEIVVVEPTGSETQVFAKLGGEEVVAVFRERHQFNPGDKIRLKPDLRVVHLFDDTTGQRINA